MSSSVRTVCLLVLLLLVVGNVLVAPAAAQVAGQNVNMVSGTQWPNGDPFLQRQNEPSMAVSTRNPLHILAGANDYRTVDLEMVLSGGEETGDAWLGLFKSFDGGLTWQSTLLPGCSYAVAQCKDNGALNSGNYQAGADPVVRAGTNGMFYYAGLAFDRATGPTTASSVSTVFVARYNDLNNNENIDPITYIDTHIVASGNASQFLDKPAMAVDIPRSGAQTCSFTANEPGAGPNGGTLAVHQSFAAGNVYVAYTDFLAATKANSTPTHLMFTHSTDCGVTWSAPVQLNTGTTTSQGSTIAVNPITGTVYVAWRQFSSSGVPNAIMIAQSSNAGKSFSAPVSVSTFQPFDQGTTDTSFRTNAYPALTTDMFGFVYVAFSARGVSSSGDARVVAAGSLDGTHWTPAIMVDNPSQSASNPSGRGHQIMPAMTFANGRLTLLYYDLRLDHYAGIYTPNPASPGNYVETLQAEGELAPPSPLPSEVFTQFIDDAGLTLRRHTLDLRVLELGIFPTIVLGPSVLVSQYDYGCCVSPESPDIEQFKFNVPNLPLFEQGQEPFLGDYIDIVPTPYFVPSGSSWAYNFMPSVNPLFHATWTDNRDVVPPPPNGSWENYTPPVPPNTPSIFQPGKTISCTVGEEGMRNQNIYTAQITGGLVVGAPGNAKPLGTTTFNGKTVPFQRAFPVEAQNVTAQPITVRFTIASQPTGGTASFLQFSLLTTLDLTIPPYSSVSRSVFATSTNAEAAITVNVAQTTGLGGSVITNGLSSSAVLNPDITNPNITNPNITNPNITNPNITNAEVTNPNITNPNITNPNITNSSTENPNITNPNITNNSYLNPNITNPNITNLNVDNVSATNPNITNPNITNPNITNPNITNPNITNPNITNPDITNGSVSDVIYPITNNGNTTASYTVKTAADGTVPSGIVLQLIINKLYQTPVASNCVLGVQTHWITVANIVSPKLFSAADPNITNPDITNGTPNEASVTLAPGETAYITIRVVNPTPATTPFNPLTVITPVTVPQAVNTTTVLSNPGNPNLTAPPVYAPLSILTTTLPATDKNDAGYAVQLLASGGKPGATTWTVVGNPPAGITLSPAGLVSGTAANPGPNTLTVQVTDTNSPADVATATLTLSVSPTVLSVQTVMPAPDGVVGQNYIAFPLVAMGGTAPITYAVVGTLPPGLSMNSSTGQIFGIPTTANPTGTSFTVTATDAAFPPETVSTVATIGIGSVIQISPTTLPAGTIGVPYSAQLSATGGIGGFAFGPPNPATGVTLQANGTLTIANPQASAISFQVTVHDSAIPVFQTVTVNYTITFAGLAGGNISFTTQPTNSIGGQVLGSSPIVVHVQDNTAAPIPGATVTMAFGNQACASATLTGNTAVVTDATGNATFTNLSIDRGQNGYTLLATVSNLTATSNNFNVSGFCPTGNLNTARSNHVAVAFTNGGALIAGGTPSPSVNAIGTAETYFAGQFTPLTAPMASPRASFTGTLLGNNSVLLAGGINAGGSSVASVETYTGGAFTADANTMSTPRDSHTATLLASGDVLIAGGENGFGNNLNTAEIYHAANGTFSAPITMTSAHVGHTATLFTNGPLQGKVLIVGGDVLVNTTDTPTAVAELYDPVANTFTATGSLNVARANHVAVLLPNGKVLIAGGSNTGNQAEGTAELYDPVAQTFSFTGSPAVAEANPSAILLANGQALVLGGTALGQSNAAQMYNPVSGTFTSIQGMVSARADFPVVLLNDSTLLITGGFNAPSSIANAEIYYPGAAPIQLVAATLPNAPADTGVPALSYSQQIQTVGGTGATTFSVVSGALPSTISLNPATGALTSAAVTDTTGVYNFTIQAASAGPPSSTATQAYTLTLVPFFTSTTPNQLPAGTEGIQYSTAISSLGGVTPFSYQQFNGTLPPGILLNNASPSATLAGTPTTAGSYVFNIQATDSSAPPQGYIEQFTLNIRPTPATINGEGTNANNQPQIFWVASTSGDVTGYNIYRSTTSGGPYGLAGSTNAATTTFADPNAPSGATYFYVVRAVAGGVESVNSNEVSVTLP